MDNTIKTKPKSTPEVYAASKSAKTRCHTWMSKCRKYSASYQEAELWNSLNPHLCVWRESSFGLGPGYSALGSSAGLCEAAGGAAAVGVRGLGCGLVQRELEAFILCLPTDTNTNSMWCFHSNIVCFAFACHAFNTVHNYTRTDPSPLERLFIEEHKQPICTCVFGFSLGAKTHLHLFSN